MKELDAYQKSLAIREMLVALNPDDPLARRDLGGSLNNIGFLLDEIGQPEQALPLYRRGAEQTEKAFAQAPQDLQIGRFLTIGLNNCASSRGGARPPGRSGAAGTEDHRGLEDDGAGQSGHPLDTDRPGECQCPARCRVFAPGATPMRPGRRFAGR